MRSSIIRLICLRELRDQLRDRRTIFMVAVLPLVIYPVLGVGVAQFAVTLTDRPVVVGISGSGNLPALHPASTAISPLPATAWLALTPTGASSCMDRCAGAAALALAARTQCEYPPLLVAGRIPSTYFDTVHESRTLRVEILESDDPSVLASKHVDLLVTVPPDFLSTLEADGRSALQFTYRQNDERSKLTAKRLYSALGKWKNRLQLTRLQRRGLPATFGEPIEVKDPERTRPEEEVAADGLFDMLLKVFPFMLVMWSLTGALYPAVDLCAGEKERGTMETLLISPASREEIVYGKFLTIWFFSAATALLNLASMGFTSAYFSGVLSHEIIRPAGIFWCVILVLPLSAFFSAVCLAVGAYARSTKEGQYYLMPLFLLTLPLVFLTLAPSVELNGFYSLVPITGVALLMQRLMNATLSEVPWLYFLPVLAPMAMYSLLALRWAIEQFKREEVLFREAERLEIRLWLRRLLREKESLPSTGQAACCFGLIVALRWLISGSHDGSIVVHTAVAYLAFVMTPPLLMALILTTRPRHSLSLKMPFPRTFWTGGLLALLLLPPLAELTLAVLRQFPTLTELLAQRQPLVEELQSAGNGEGTYWWLYLVVFALMPALFEEIAFRGFILNGLRHRLRPWTAIILSSFLFAIYHMNVFQALPAFALGIVLGLLAVWSGSVLPGMLLHLLYNGVLIGMAVLPGLGSSQERMPFQGVFSPLLTIPLTALALFFLVALGRRVAKSPPGMPAPPPVKKHLFTHEEPVPALQT